jgi:hypothetical protein
VERADVVAVQRDRDTLGPRHVLRHRERLAQGVRRGGRSPRARRSSPNPARILAAADDAQARFLAPAHHARTGRRRGPRQRRPGLAGPAAARRVDG